MNPYLNSLNEWGGGFVAFWRGQGGVDATGGFWFDYDQELSRRKTDQIERDRLEDEARQIQVRIDRELALEFRKQESEEARLEELERLSRLAEIHRQVIEKQLTNRVLIAADRAIKQGNFSAMEAFDREISRLREEEQFLLMALTTILND